MKLTLLHCMMMRNPCYTYIQARLGKLQQQHYNEQVAKLTEDLATARAALKTGFTRTAEQVQQLRLTDLRCRGGAPCKV